MNFIIIIILDNLNLMLFKKEKVYSAMEKQDFSINNFQIYKLITESDNIQKIRGDAFLKLLPTTTVSLEFLIWNQEI